MDRELKGKVALVTGASRGIGRAIAVGLARKGMNVALVARNRERLVETAQECQSMDTKTLVLPFDLSHTEGIRELVEHAHRDLGGLHVLINNAGIGGSGKADEADVRDWDQTLNVNLRAMMHLTRYALPYLEKSDWGAVINIASIAGKQSMKGSGAYSATKHGVLGFTGSLFEDVRERNIKVCAICPGFVNTDLVRNAKADPNKMIQPDDILRTVLYVLRFPDSGCPTEITLRPQRTPYE